MIVAGIGCRAGSSAEQIETAIRAVLNTLLPAGSSLDRIATAAAKGDEPGIRAAARAMHVPLVIIPHERLEAACAAVITRSAHALAALGVESVAEAAALVGAGSGARLLAPRQAIGPVTCALAEGDESE